MKSTFHDGNLKQRMIDCTLVKGKVKLIPLRSLIRQSKKSNDPKTKERSEWSNVDIFCKILNEEFSFNDGRYGTDAIWIEWREQRERRKIWGVFLAACQKS